MKLWELQAEIDAFRRIYNTDWEQGDIYLVKSVYGNEKALVECDFSSMQLRDYVPTLEELFSDKWCVLE
jgi:predicted nuclease of restriction endonuclease-like RecB superfamily